MRKEKQIVINTIVLFLLSFSIVRTVTGDAIPPAILYSAVQENQDVKIGIKVPEERGELDIQGEIVRVQGDLETTVHSNIIFFDETPTFTESVCGSNYYEFVYVDEFCETYPDSCLECDNDEATTCIGESCDTCAEQQAADIFYPADTYDVDAFCDLYPAYAVDCDGDGENECCLACEQYLHYDFWDRCVPPGTTEYQLHDDSTWDEYSMSTVSPFEIVEFDLECLDPLSTDEPTDSDSQTADSSDEPISSSTDSETPFSTDTSTSTDEPSSTKVSGGGGCSTSGFLKTASSLSILHLLFK